MRKGILYDFAGFRIDTEQRCLLRGEEIVSLTPKAFDTLSVLVRNPGKVMTKDVLLDEVWKDTFVEESTLAQNISTLRKTLSKYDHQTDFIVTIPRRGYRFVADVTETDAEEEILVVEKRSVTHIVAEQEQIADAPKGWLSAKWVAGISAAAAALVVSVFASSYLLSQPTQFESRFRQFRISTLFSGENISNASVSPDGKYIAVLRGEDDGDALFLRQITDGNEVALVRGNDLNISGVVFAPEGDGVYYSAYKRSDPFPKIGNLYKVPMLGGASRVIARDVDGPVTFSPDQNKFAFVRDKLEEMESVLILANADGSSPRELASRPLWNGFSTSGVSWSPDGGRIAVTVMEREDRDGPMKLATVDANTGEVSVLSGNDWLWIGKTAWLEDSSGVVVVAYGAKSPNLTDEVWFVSYPDGAARPVTRGLSGITGFGITRAGETMIAGKNNRLTTRSYLDVENPDVSRVIAKSVSEDSLLPLGARFVGENKIVYAKTQNGNADIWMMNLDGSANVQLTSEPEADYDPVVSPDGRHIVFRSNRKGRMTLWEMEMDGSNQREIIDLHYSSRASFSDDATAMYFSAVPMNAKFQVLFRRDTGSGRFTQLTDFRSFRPSVSPDGKYILCFAVENGDTKFAPAAPVRLTLYSIADKKIVKQFEKVRTSELPIIEWKHDSNGFYYVKKKEKSNFLYERGLDGEITRTVKRWDEGNVFQIALSADGKRLFFEKGEDVVSVLKFENAGGV